VRSRCFPHGTHGVLTQRLYAVAWLEPACAHAKRIERLAHAERKRVCLGLAHETNFRRNVRKRWFVRRLTGSGTCKSSKR
jgi:hypothetical protein